MARCQCQWLAAALLIVACARPQPGVVEEAERRAAEPSEYEFGAEGGGGATDCSGYVNGILAKSAPHALATLAELRPRPRAREYAELLERGGADWHPVRRVADLQAGDVLAWEYAGTSAARVDSYVSA